MLRDYGTNIDNLIGLSKDEGPNKIISLKEAVENYIKPGMSIHFCFTHYRANCVAYEIARQFQQRKPMFTLIATGVLEYGIILVYCGLIKRIIGAFFGDTYPSPSPNPILQQAFKSREVEVEFWSNLTIPMRLMAGAFDIEYIVTKSILQSSMEEANRDSLAIIPDPYDPARKIALMKALNPDIAIIHGWAADLCGNTIFLPPYGENFWGAWASKGGVLVTVEKIVSTEFIRKYSHFVKIPGHIVKSVSVVPFGAHPNGMSNQGLCEFEAYAEDYEFKMDFRRAARDSRKFENWINEWVLGCKSHESYLRKLGSKRLIFLKGKANREAWKYEIANKLHMVEDDSKCNQLEMMVIVASRVIKKRVLESRYSTVLAGIGISSLAAWIAYYQLKRQGHEKVELLAETGFYGYAPRANDPFIFNLANIPTNKMQSNFIEILGHFASGVNRNCLGVIGAGQIDRHGNINSTYLSDGTYLTGSGGVNDVSNGANELIVVMQQSKSRLVNNVDYVTANNKNVRVLVSNFGVFERNQNNPEFILTKCLPIIGLATLEEKVKAVRENCSWEVRPARVVTEEEPPTLEELKLLRLFDPEKLYTKS
jgi:acyl CoA:acetate/3-ketoacid CoA transferase alpha subunit/acyl CoA:acetate/3-ketoacid CoA transferase beta subunit